MTRDLPAPEPDWTLFDWLARGAARPDDFPPSYSLHDWWDVYHTSIARWWSEPIERSIAGGFLADRVAFAFASAHQAALRQMVPELPDDHIVALAVTEERGGHPRAIKAHLKPTGDGFSLNGTKTFTTLAQMAGELLVAGSLGADRATGRNLIRIVRVDTAAPTVAIRDLPPPPFVPEIPHGIVTFRDTPVEFEAFLRGDGYVNLIKPFRTLEDLHVVAALTGYLLRVSATAGWERDVAQRIMMLAAAAAGLARLEPLGPGTHVALGGLLAELERLMEDLEPAWETVDREVRERWRRDRAVLTVAGTARARRLEVAWGRCGAP